MAAAPVLQSWDQIKGNAGDWSAILIGNGASMNVSSTFNYQTLLERACTMENDDRLNDVDRALFLAIKTVDFELVLAHLRYALVVGTVTGATNPYMQQLEAQYTRIRRALAAAVRGVHPPHKKIGEGRLKQLGQELVKYKWVFSTNYDLIVYWAAMTVGIENFYDYLGGKPCRFRRENIAEAPENKTKLLFPHGALHLYVPEGEFTGMVHKRVNDEYNILDQLLFFEDAPLIVAEGSPDDKKKVIYSHRYLTFAFEQLGKVRDPLVIFGSNLGSSDEHIVQELVPKGRRIAVSIRGGGDEASKTMARMQYVLAEAGEVIFFSADSHPLGNPALTVA